MVAGCDLIDFVDRAGNQKENDQHRVDECNRRLKEIVVVLGDEFPKLINEGTEAGPADDHRCGFPDITREDDQHPEGDHHAQSTPQHVGDMERRVSDLRIAGQLEIEPDTE